MRPRGIQRHCGPILARLATARRVTTEERFRALADASSRSGGPPIPFLRFRRNQLDLILTQAEIDLRGKTVLEIGGGVSGQSFLMAGLADRVICSDLLDMTTIHGGDLSKAAAFARADPERRLTYVCARAEQLPFGDRSVDVVFSSFVFEHVGDRDVAAAEMLRVLKPGGAAIVNVPSTWEPIFRVGWFAFTVLPRQLIKAALAWTGLVPTARFRRPPPPRPTSVAAVRAWASSELTYAPHGTYPDHLTEIRRSRPAFWDQLFERCGFRVERRFAVAVENFAFFSERATAWFQERLMPFVARQGRTPLVIALASSYCVVLRKPSSVPTTDA